MIRIDRQTSLRAKIGACKGHNYATQKIATNRGDFGKANRREHLSQPDEEPKNVEI